ncbi:hypothetical protein LUX33_17595 [Actinomadura madurae]|nr:hypothetical protein [Actinomadura madurae]MCP9950045.1 hypothetical protein [Actinomadura madurae]
MGARLGDLDGEVRVGVVRGAHHAAGRPGLGQRGGEVGEPRHAAVRAGRGGGPAGVDVDHSGERQPRLGMDRGGVLRGDEAGADDQRRHRHGIGFHVDGS